MNITSDKVAMNSTQLLKTAKKNSTSSVDNNEKLTMAEKLHRDFASAGMSQSYVKNKIISNNAQLLSYENRVSENQFVSERLKEVQNLVAEGKKSDAWQVITTSSFEQKNVLANMFDENAPLETQLDYAQLLVMKDRVELAREFRALQVAAQNLSSISPNPQVLNNAQKSEDELKAQLQSDISSYSTKNGELSGKRVMDLIS